MSDAHADPDREDGPLQGERVVVTRPPRQADSLARRLRELGAEPVACPTIRIVPPEDPGPLAEAVRSLESYRWVVFTSVNGVKRLAGRLSREDRPGGPFAGTMVAAIGPATAERARAELGLRPQVVPGEYRAEALARAIRRRAAPPGEAPPPWPEEDARDAGRELEGARVLLPRAAEARPVLPERLREAGATVDEVAAYRALPPEVDDVAPVRELIESGDVDWLTFTASSTVRNFAGAVGTETGGARVAAIGPITAETAREHGLPVDVVAEEYTVPGLVEALARASGGDGGREAA